MNEVDFGNKFPYCEGNNVTEITNFWDLQKSLLQFKCENLPRCKRSIYDASFEPSFEKPGVNKALVRIQLASSTVEFITDSYDYDLQSFIGEVGGTLGLLLGLSFLSVFDLFELFLQKKTS